MAWQTLLKAAPSLIAGGLAAKSAYDTRRSQERAQDYTEDYNRERLDFLRQGAQQARQDMLTGLPAQVRAQRRGLNAAAGLTGQVTPEMARLSRVGNMMAQQQLLAGLPMQQNAIMGLPVDYSALKARAPKMDASMLQGVQMPAGGLNQLVDALQGNTQLGQGGNAVPSEGMTNLEVLNRARDSGAISDYDHYAISYVMGRREYSNPDSKHWASDVSRDDLLASIPDWMHPSAKTALRNFFTVIKPTEAA